MLHGAAPAEPPTGTNSREHACLAAHRAHRRPAVTLQAVASETQQPKPQGKGACPSRRRWGHLVTSCPQKRHVLHEKPPTTDWRSGAPRTWPSSPRGDSRAGNTSHPRAGSAVATQYCLSGSPSTQPRWGLIASLQVASRNATVSLPCQHKQHNGTVLAAGCDPGGDTQSWGHVWAEPCTGRWHIKPGTAWLFGDTHGQGTACYPAWCLLQRVLWQSPWVLSGAGR